MYLKPSFYQSFDVIRVIVVLGIIVGTIMCVSSQGQWRVRTVTIRMFL